MCPAACSNYHVELNPSDVGSQDRYVVQEVIKELAKNRPLDVAGAQRSTPQHRTQLACASAARSRQDAVTDCTPPAFA